MPPHNKCDFTSQYDPDPTASPHNPDCTAFIVCSNVLEDYELKSLQSEHAAEQYAVHHEPSKRTQPGWKDPKQKIQAEISQRVHHVQDAFNVFKERGVLHQTEYAANIPAAVHGAPKTAEVFLKLFCLRKPKQDQSSFR